MFCPLNRSLEQPNRLAISESPINGVEMARSSEEGMETHWTVREAGVSVTPIAKDPDRQNPLARQFIADHGGT